MSATDLWTFERCREQLGTLPGRLGFPKGPALSFLWLRLDLATGILVSEPDNRPVPGLRPAVFCILDSYSRAGDAPEEFRPVPFDRLPGGAAYAAAFRRRATLAIAGHYARDREKFTRVLEGFGGVPVAYAGQSWKIPALPRVPLYILIWDGGDEFPPSANLLFDASASSFLPTEAAAMLGELLAERIAFFLDG